MSQTDARAESVSVTWDNAQRRLRLQWDDQPLTEYHYVWLRHSARIPFGMANDTSVKIDLVPDEGEICS